MSRYDAVSSYGSDPADVSSARRWTERELAVRLPGFAGGDVIGDAALVVSELVTNAIRAGSATIRLGITVEGECIRIGVFDDAPGAPRKRMARSGDTSGRGLPIVEMVAEQWGVEASRGGKEVWALLAIS